MSSKDNDINPMSTKDHYDTDKLPNLSNTLDLYNDAISKNAVSSLFKDDDFFNTQDNKNDNSPKVSNSDSLDNQIANSQNNQTSINSNEKSELSISKENKRKPHGSFPAGFENDADDIVVFDKSSSSSNSGSDALEESSKNNRKIATAKFFDDEFDEPTNKSSRKVTSDDDEKSSSRRERLLLKKSTFDEDDIEEDDEIEEETHISSRRSRSRAVATHDDDEDEDYYDDDYDPKGLLTFSIGSISILLLILTYLLFQVRSLNKEIDANLTQLSEYTSIRQDYESLKIENDGLSQQIASLNSQLQGVNNSSGSSTSDTSSSNNSSNSSSSSSLPEPEATIYTVKSGDTLSSISSAMYGVSSEYAKIKEANNLTSDNLTVGQKLVIPY